MTPTTESIPDPLPSSRLFYCDGGSDKVYHACINAVGDGFTVMFAFGRRGSALMAGTKTTAPVVGEKAQQIYDKMIAEKTGKGDGETGHIERFNNVLRQRLARFVRRTLSFSKIDVILEACSRLFLHAYNQPTWH